MAAWLGLCLVLFLSSCSTLHRAEPKQPAYRITVVLAPGGNETDMTAALSASPVCDLEFRQVVNVSDLTGQLGGGQVVSLTLAGQAAVDHFREVLQSTGVSVQAFTVRRLN